MPSVCEGPLSTLSGISLHVPHTGANDDDGQPLLDGDGNVALIVICFFPHTVRWKLTDIVVVVTLLRLINVSEAAIGQSSILRVPSLFGPSSRRNAPSSGLSQVQVRRLSPECEISVV